MYKDDRDILTAIELLTNAREGIDRYVCDDRDIIAAIKLLTNAREGIDRYVCQVLTNKDLIETGKTLSAARIIMSLKRNIMLNMPTEFYLIKT